MNTQIAREYRDKYGMVMPTLTLARIMYNENKEVFKNIESARVALRYIEGKSGGKVRCSSIKNSPYFMSEPRPRNPYALPRSYKNGRKLTKLPSSCTEILLMSDIHIPYHCTESLTKVFDYGVDESNKINCVVLNGDVIDFHRISKHETDLRKRSTVQEFEAANQFLCSLRKAFPDIPVYWLKGNHDIRWDKYLQVFASEIWDDQYFSLEARLNLKEKNITLISDDVLVMAGDLLITHGHHLVRGGGVSPAKKAYLKAAQSVIMSHLHKRDHYRKKNATQTDMQEAYVTGCLCELTPHYNIINDGENGFAHISIKPGGKFIVRNYEIDGVIKL